jgi:hypothetical protein
MHTQNDPENGLEREEKEEKKVLYFPPLWTGWCYFTVCFTVSLLLLLLG